MPNPDIIKEVNEYIDELAEERGLTGKDKVTKDMRDKIMEFILKKMHEVDNEESN